MVKNLPANAGDVGLISGSGRSSGRGNGYLSSILAWEIPGKVPGGLRSMGSQRVRQDLATKQQLLYLLIQTYGNLFIKCRIFGSSVILLPLFIPQHSTTCNSRTTLYLFMLS